MPRVPQQKPSKPYPDFPLFAHATGRWAKKIKGKLCYFGPWDDPDAALQKYLDERDDLQAGRVPRGQSDGNSVTVAYLCNSFLASKRHLLDTPELSPRTFGEYHKTCKDIAAFFGRRRLAADVRPEDFDRLRAKFAKTLGPVQLGNTIQRVRSVFKFGFDAMLLEKPTRFGPHFKRPSRRAIRHVRNQRGLRMFEAAEIRRIPLWPETVESLRTVMEADRKPAHDPDHDSLVFLTVRGRPWTRAKRVPNPKPGAAEFAVIDSVGLEFGKLLKRLGIKRPGVSFYALRHGFETVAGESRDQVAVDSLMGHVDSSMAGLYRERISDERLIEVTNHVRRWLWPKAK